MLSTKITRKGQITIPVEIRNELNLQEGERMTVTRVGSKIIMESEIEIVRRTAGALFKYAKTPPASIEDEKAAFAQAIVDDYVESLKDQR